MTHTHTQGRVHSPDNLRCPVRQNRYVISPADTAAWNGHVWLLLPIGSWRHKLHHYFAGCGTSHINQNTIFYLTVLFICKFYFFMVVIGVMRGSFIITSTRFCVYCEINMSDARSSDNDSYTCGIVSIALCDGRTDFGTVPTPCDKEQYKLISTALK
jgi:hypothetical protein